MSAGVGRRPPLSEPLPDQAQLDAISAATGEGLSLGQAASLAGVPHGRLVVVVALADAGQEPYAAWLLGICRTAAESRRQLLADLKQLGAVDARARRDWLKERGQPGPLERELGELRRQAERSEAVQLEVSAFEATRRRSSSGDLRSMSDQARAELHRSFHFGGEPVDGDNG
jgi:hypothetical protein